MDRQQIFAITRYFEKRLKGKVHVDYSPKNNKVLISFVKGDFYYHKETKYTTFDAFMEYEIDYILREIIESYIRDEVITDEILIRAKLIDC